MVWAIDLDDGTLLTALSSVSSRPKQHTRSPNPSFLPDFESPWPEEKEKDEL